MLQRIQTIYLLLVLAVAILLLFANIPLFDIVIKRNPKESFSFLSNGFSGTSNLSINIVLITLSLVALFTVFLFKNMTLQLRFTIILFILMFILYAFIFYNINMLSYELHYIIEYRWGLYLPLSIGLFSILAFNGIKKDLRRIKSSRSIR